MDKFRWHTMSMLTQTSHSFFVPSLLFVVLQSAAIPDPGSKGRSCGCPPGYCSKDRQVDNRDGGSRSPFIAGRRRMHCHAEVQALRASASLVPGVFPHGGLRWGGFIPEGRIERRLRRHFYIGPFQPLEFAPWLQS
ncbi:hypothetical protein EV126DRAFT_451056, partial [Verticillium dahliae]